jgi:hypothetical protein
LYAWLGLITLGNDAQSHGCQPWVLAEHAGPATEGHWGATHQLRSRGKGLDKQPAVVYFWTARLAMKGLQTERWPNPAIVINDWVSQNHS